MTTDKRVVEFVKYRGGTLLSLLESEPSIDGSVAIVQRAIDDEKVTPDEVLTAISGAKHPFGIMSQLSALLQQDLDAMRPYMEALSNADPEEWRNGEAQPFVDVYWQRRIMSLIDKKMFKDAFDTINSATQGYGRRDDTSEVATGLQLVASTDVLWRLVNTLHKKMKKTILRKQPRPGMLLARRLGAILPKRASLPNQIGIQVLEIAAFFATESTKSPIKQKK